MIDTDVSDVREEVQRWIFDEVEYYATRHIEGWREHYSGLSKKEAIDELDYQHDFSIEATEIEDGLGVELSEKEYDFWKEKFNQKVIEILYSDENTPTDDPSNPKTKGDD